MVGDETDHLSVKAEYDPVGGFAQMHRVVDDRLKNGPKVSPRAAYNGQALRVRCLLFQRLSQFAQQPCILNRNHGLIGESCDELYLLFGEWVHLIAGKGEDTNHLSLTQ